MSTNRKLLTSIMAAAFVAGVALWPARCGWAADQAAPAILDSPLLVVVETGAGAGCDAVHVRRAVQDELGVAVLALTTLPPKGAATLLVRVDRERILLTFRGQSTAQVSRMIAAPPDMSSRLQAISWLAGNLVRDQLTPLVIERNVSPADSAAPILPSPSASASTPAPVARPLTVSVAVTRPATEPPPLAASSAVRPSLPAPDPRDQLLRVTSVAADTRTESPWSVTIAGGPVAAYDRHSPEGPRVGLAPAWQLELQHHRNTGAIYGLALDLGPEPGRVGGIAGLAGAGWLLGSWVVEATAAAGLEAQREYSAIKIDTVATSDGVNEVTTYGRELRPALYVRGMVALGRPLTRSVDLLLRIGAHLASHDLVDDFYLSTSLGLRLRLP